MTVTATRIGIAALLDASPRGALGPADAAEPVITRAGPDAPHASAREFQDREHPALCGIPFAIEVDSPAPGAWPGEVPHGFLQEEGP